MKGSKQVPIHTISFEKADGYAVTEQDVLREELTKLGLYGSQFAYSAFDPAKLGLVLETGTFHSQDGGRRDDIACCVTDSLFATEPGIRDNEEHDLVHYLEIAAEGSSFATFAVYDRTKLKAKPEGPPYYMFKEPDKKLETLLAVVKIEDFNR